MDSYSSLPLPPDGSAISGANPFEDQLRMAREMVYPQFPRWALAILLSFVCLRGMTVLICVGIVIVPLIKGAKSRKKHFLLIRRVYSEGRNQTPYIVPNRCLVIVICELFSSLIYLMTAYSNYIYDSATEYPQGVTNQIVTWYEFAWLPAYVGIWISTWSLVHSCLRNVDGTQRHRLRFLTPRVYNFLWTSWPILVIFITTYWAVRINTLTNSIDIIMSYTEKLLRKSAKNWDVHQDFSKIPLGTLIMNRDSLFRYRDVLRNLAFFCTGSWMAFGLVLGICYLTTVRILLRMLRQVLRIRDTEAWILKAQSPIWRELEQEIRFLSGCSWALTLAIGSQVCASIFQLLSARHLTDPKWRIGSSIVDHLPGIFMVPVQLLQSWRILSEHSVADESEFRNIPLDVKDKEFPQMTSQLLGWDTSAWFGSDADLEITNFPGLREVSSHIFEPPSTSGHSDPDKSNLDIKVVRSTVIT
ncbi:hypothetical protein DFH28DRAFT_983541 [Melampsora americana]|nr:hypothetical protein DFH28DRAFT_983541 [Melampsora americana]